MDQNKDFSQLRNLLALNKLEMPNDTQVDQFLTEFHHRQRVGMLVRDSLFARGMGWLKNLTAGLQIAPALSYGSAFAALALVAFLGLSQQAQVPQGSTHGYQLSFQMPSRDGAFAMLGNAFGTAAAAPRKMTDSVTFAPARSDAGTTRFVLANNSRVAYDATVAF